MTGQGHSRSPWNLRGVDIDSGPQCLFGHWLLSVSLSPYLYVSPHVCMSLPMSVCLSPCLYVSPHVCMSLPKSVCISPCLYVSPHASMSLPMSICLSPCLYVSPHVCMSLPMFVCLSLSISLSHFLPPSHCSSLFALFCHLSLPPSLSYCSAFSRSEDSE